MVIAYRVDFVRKSDYIRWVRCRQGFVAQLVGADGS